MRGVIDPGEFTKFLLIEEPRARPSDAHGQPDDEPYRVVDGVWAKLMPLTGRTFYLAQQAKSEATHEITLRFTTAVKPVNRFRFGSRLFSYESAVNPDEANEFLAVMVKEAR